jgi:hypothetical protein
LRTAPPVSRAVVTRGGVLLQAIAETSNAPTATLSGAACCLIIRLIIQTIRRVESRSDQNDKASIASRPDRSGPDQIDIEHQARNRKCEEEVLSPCRAGSALPLAEQWVHRGRWRSFP